MSLSRKDREASQKIEEHDNSSAGSDYNSCWGRFCSPNKSSAVRDVLRGLLVVVVVGIISAIIFLLCYFLIHDLEKKEEKLVNDIGRKFSDEESRFKPTAEYSIGNQANENNIEYLNNYSPMAKEPDIIQDLYSNNHDEQLAVLEYEKERLPAIQDDYPKEESYDIGFKNMHVDDIRKIAEPSLPNKPECKPLKLQLCSGSMPWSLTIMPNWINNTNIAELQESLAYFQSVIVGSSCSQRANEYTCAILEPQCGLDSVILPPCRTFCLDVLNSCSEYLVENASENYGFDCNRFPHSVDPTVCVDIHKDLSESRVAMEETSEPFPIEARSHFPESSSRQETRRKLESVSRDVSEPSEVSVQNEITPQAPIGQPPQGPNKSAPEGFEPLICVHSKFLCDDGSDCLDHLSICDGVSDCLDSSDEKPINCRKAVNLAEHSLSYDSSPPNKRQSLSEMLSNSRILSNPNFSSRAEDNTLIGASTNSRGPIRLPRPLRNQVLPITTQSKEVRQHKSLAQLLSTKNRQQPLVNKIGTNKQLPVRPVSTVKINSETSHKSLSSILSSFRRISTKVS